MTRSMTRSMTIFNYNVLVILSFLSFLSFLFLLFILILLFQPQKQEQEQEQEQEPTASRNACIKNQDNVTMCQSENAYISEKEKLLDSKNELLERETIKSVITPKVSAKLMKQHNIFRPSMMYGTFCNNIYTTYYDFTECSYPNNIFEHVNKEDIKRVRIRHYYFDPNSFFEIKYKKHKIRVQIDCDFNILDPEKIDSNYKQLVVTMLRKIKSGEMKELFYNEYKRFSFIYKNDPLIRMTIDTEIKIKYMNLEQTLDFNILEVKYPVDISEDIIHEYFSEIDADIEFTDFSKVDYTIHNMIVPEKYKARLENVNW